MAFEILRITNLTVSSMQVIFTEDVNPTAGTENVSLVPTVNNISTPSIISLSVEGSTISLTFSPIFPDAQYQLTFFSTNTIFFQSINNGVINENGVGNVRFITSPGDAVNATRDSIIQALPPVYNTDQSVVYGLINGMAEQIQRAQESIVITGSANYLSVPVIDELETRTDGPTDQLQHSGAFEISRVGLVPTGTTTYDFIEFDSTRLQSFRIRNTIIVNPILGALTSDPISLQAIDVVAEQVSDNSESDNHFNGMSIYVANSPVIQVVSVSLLHDDVYIEYDIEKYGYTLQSNRYDTFLSGINVNFTANEILLSNNALTGLPGAFQVPAAGDTIYISYVYKKLGRIVDPASVQLWTDNKSVREIAPTIVNSFSTKRSPIVTSSDVIATSGGVQFLATENAPGITAFVSTHPAFTQEIKYSLTNFPSAPGQFSVDYKTGAILVFGSDLTNSGTGEAPPAMTYNYRQIFVSGIDYTYDPSTYDLAVNSSRNIFGILAKVSFSYEDVFTPGKDYRILSHVESLEEYVDNRLIGDFKVSTLNYPVSDVFRIFNQTTGEIYSLSTFNDTSITFTGQQAPIQKSITRERAALVRVPQETLYVADVLTNLSNLTIWQINLANNSISDSQSRFVGSNFDTSAIFSRTDIFQKEFFYDSQLNNLQTNLNRLTLDGDYLINYVNGIIYVAVPNVQSSDIGNIGYVHGVIKTVNPQILNVFNIYRSSSALSPNAKAYTPSAITNTTVEPIGLEQVGQRFSNNDISEPLIVGSVQGGADAVASSGGYYFISNSAVFSNSDIGNTIQVEGPREQVVIANVINPHQILVGSAFVADHNGNVWTEFSTNPSSPKTISLAYDISFVRGIYLTSQLYNVSSGELVNYFNINTDTFNGNVVTLGPSSPLQIGDTVLIDYNYGDLFVDYQYLRDRILISYEYGYDTIDWSISNSIATGTNYYVTYKYGALREALLQNFGSLTQIRQLTNFSPTLNREVYRSIVGGTLQSFITGPTIGSIKTLVESFTDVAPNIEESAFNFWTLGTNSLCLRPITSKNVPVYDTGKFELGLEISEGQSLQVPALSHIGLNEGTIETWISPQWSGLANDSSLTLDLAIDGYKDPSNVYIGFSGTSPLSMPFTLNINDTIIPVSGSPANLNTASGYFVWYDTSTQSWQMLWQESSGIHTFTGAIQSTGRFYGISYPDGYVTSTTSDMSFISVVDSYMSFSSGDDHYIFDMAAQDSSNRMSIFKDGTGYLNFQVFDDRNSLGLPAGYYNLSTNVSSWVANIFHHVAVSWRVNSVNEQDEMHLFIDGFEVPNLFTYGGNPRINSSDTFGSVAQETLIPSAFRPIVGGNDGITVAASDIFASPSANFAASGIMPGDGYLYILDNTPDGTGSPNNGAPYFIIGVGETTLLLDRPTTLGLSNVNFSVNRALLTIDIPVTIQDFIVLVKDQMGNETELPGLNAITPYYSVSTGPNGSYILSINNGVNIYDSVVIEPIGLMLQNTMESVYVYGDGYNTIRTSALSPVTLDSVDITNVILDQSLLTSANGSFYNVTQPSSSVNGPNNGRLITVFLDGDNLNFSNPSFNQVTIDGYTCSDLSMGPEVISQTSVTLSFSESGSLSDGYYWTEISSIHYAVTSISPSTSFGTLEVDEHESITISENYGWSAKIVEDDNGLMTLEIAGSGGEPYVVGQGLYKIGYPSFLQIALNKVPDTFSIGSDQQGQHSADAILDEFRILNYLSTDTRIGEVAAIGTRTVTTDYTSNFEFSADDSTLLLMHFDGNINDSSLFIDRFDTGYETAPSVNSTFGNGIRLSQGAAPFEVNNATFVFNNNQGTIEFWVSPMDDSHNDPDYHYYIDMMAIVQEQDESLTNVIVTTAKKINSVISVRLITDTFNTGINYFTGGKVSSVDGKTITLGTPLPAQNMEVKISYVPIGNNGDRVSIFKDPNSFINFFMQASGAEHLISVPINWVRHSWHRIMVMWEANSPTGQDRLRLFVDGNESGVIKYGTGLIYGTGIIWGQQEVRPGHNRYITDTIALIDTFSTIYIGADVFGQQGARAVLDNIRFSNIQRLQEVILIAGQNIDAGYTANSQYAIPVIKDTFTTAMYDFDYLENEVRNLATVINGKAGIFTFTVDVIDSFDKVLGNTILENLLTGLINTIKPATSTAVIKFNA